MLFIVIKSQMMLEIEPKVANIQHKEKRDPRQMKGSYTKILGIRISKNLQPIMIDKKHTIDIFIPVAVTKQLVYSQSGKQKYIFQYKLQ